MMDLNTLKAIRDEIPSKMAFSSSDGFVIQTGVRLGFGVVSTTIKVDEWLDRLIYEAETGKVHPENEFLARYIYHEKRVLGMWDAGIVTRPFVMRIMMLIVKLIALEVEFDVDVDYVSDDEGFTVAVLKDGHLTQFKLRRDNYKVIHNDGEAVEFEELDQVCQYVLDEVAQEYR